MAPGAAAGGPSEPLSRSRAVVLLTTFDEDAAIIEALRAGVQGFLIKEVSLEELADAIRHVAAGETLLPPGVAERVARGLAELPRDFPHADLPDGLTRREVEVLRLLSKLGVRDRTRAVRRARELGCL